MARQIALLIHERPTYLPTGSCSTALSLNELAQLSPTNATTAKGDDDPIDRDLALSYAPVLGSPELRARVAELHSEPPSSSSSPSPPARALTAEDVIITPGSIMANYLVLASLLAAGDHAVCQYPTYAQLYELPRYLGVEVDLWRARPEDGWLPRARELEVLIRPNTKAIIITLVERKKN